MSDGISKVKVIFETQMIGVCRVALGMPLEHSFDRIKTHMQQKLNTQTFVESCQEIYQSKGIIEGLYAGFSPNFMRWPMMILIPNYYLSVLPNDVNLNFPALYKTLTGVTIGLFESLIICPLERVKCFRMTNIAQSRASSILLMGSSQEIIKFLYTGLQVQASRQVVSWTSYLYWDHKLRHSFKQSYNDKLSIKNTILCSFASSLLNVTLGKINRLINIDIVQPFDTIKTLYQMEHNQAYQNQPLSQAFKDVYQKVGMKGLYSGWQMRIVAFFSQALLTTPTIDYLERQYGRSNEQLQ